MPATAITPPQDQVFFSRSTYPLRMRSMCNQVKAALLGAAHTPHEPQALDLLACPDAPIKDGKTWHTWWDGKVKLQRGSREACDRASPLASRWIEHTHMGHAVQRHLEAIEAMHALDPKARAEQVARSMDGLRKAWLAFTSRDKLNDFDLAVSTRMLTGGATPLPSSLRYADARANTLVAAGLCNPLFYAVPQSVQAACDTSTPFGLLQYLVNLSKAPGDLPEQCLPALVMDLASCVALVHADRNASEVARSDAFGKGRLLWDHALNLALIKATSKAGDGVWRNWQAIRGLYYLELRDWGISFRDMHRLVGPVKSLGASTMIEHMKPGPDDLTIPLRTVTGQSLHWQLSH